MHLGEMAHLSHKKRKQRFGLLRCSTTLGIASLVMDLSSSTSNSKNYEMRLRTQKLLGIIERQKVSAQIIASSHPLNFANCSGNRSNCDAKVIRMRLGDTTFL